MVTLYTPAFATVREMFSGFQAHPCSRVSHTILCSIYWPCRAEMDLPAVVILRTRVPAQWHFSISLAAIAQFYISSPICSIMHCLVETSISSHPPGDSLSCRVTFIFLLRSATHCHNDEIVIDIILQATHCPARSSSTSFSRRLTVLRDRHRHHSPGDSLSCEIVYTASRRLTAAGRVLISSLTLPPRLFSPDNGASHHFPSVSSRSYRHRSSSSRRFAFFSSAMVRRLLRPPFRTNRKHYGSGAVCCVLGLSIALSGTAQAQLQCCIIHEAALLRSTVRRSDHSRQRYRKPRYRCASGEARTWDIRSHLDSLS